MWPRVSAAGVVRGRVHASGAERCPGGAGDVRQTPPQHRGSLRTDGSGTHRKTRRHHPSGQPIRITHRSLTLRFSSNRWRAASREEVMWLLMDMWHFWQDRVLGEQENQFGSNNENAGSQCRHMSDCLKTWKTRFGNLTIVFNEIVL